MHSVPYMCRERNDAMENTCPQNEEGSGLLANGAGSMVTFTGDVTIDLVAKQTSSRGVYLGAA